MKQCPTCLKKGQGPKSLSAFNKNRNRSDGLQDKCRDHTREYCRQWAKQNPEKNRAKGKRFREQNADAYRRLSVRANLKRYGLSESAYAGLFEQQDGRCAVCNLAMVSQLDSSRAESKGQGFAPENFARVDHDHRTGKVRGLLCFSCNVGLGKFRDDKELLLSAVRYLCTSTTAQNGGRVGHDTTRGVDEPQARDLDRAQADERRRVPISLKLVR